MVQVRKNFPFKAPLSSFPCKRVSTRLGWRIYKHGVWAVSMLFSKKKNPVPSTQLPTGLSSPFSSHSTGFLFYFQLQEFLPTILCPSRWQIHSAASVASQNEAKAQEQMKARICPGEGAGQAWEWEWSLSRAGEAGARRSRPVAETPDLQGKSVNRPRNSQMNWWLMEWIVHAALPSCKKGFICPFL